MHIDLVEDTVCPWCRIGKRNLETAISNWDGDPVTVSYHPYFLHPGVPEAGKDFREHMEMIKGDKNIEPLLQRVCAAGEVCGVSFDFDKVERYPNTALSHVLIAHAPKAQQSATIDAIFAAYFDQGRDIGNPAVLLDIADEVGLDRAAAAAALADPQLRAEVNAEADALRRQGISGVPFFIFDRSVAVSGAQPPAALLDAMRQAESMTPATKGSAAG